MLVLLGLSLQIKTLTFSYVNRDLRREYLRNKNIDKAGEITKRKAGRPPPGPVNKSGQVPEDDDSSNEWSQPYYKESELCPEMKQEMDKKQYPSNINLHDYLYFLVVPTLVYISPPPWLSIPFQAKLGLFFSSVLSNCVSKKCDYQHKEPHLPPNWDVLQLSPMYSYTRRNR